MIDMLLTFARLIVLCEDRVGNIFKVLMSISATRHSWGDEYVACLS